MDSLRRKICMKFVHNSHQSSILGPTSFSPESTTPFS